MIGIGLLTSAQVNSSHANVGSTPVMDEWNFRVYLDDSDIGFHRFTRTRDDDITQITTSARFKVKFLFITAYSYEHDNAETWKNGCLNSINALTNDNGTEYRVTGSDAGNSFSFDDGESAPTDCVSTFAYWDPSFLKSSSLLNSQTGELVDISSSDLGPDTLIVGEQEIEARKFRLSGENLQIDLWYSPEGHWLGLESLTEGGNTIRYSIDRL